MFASLDIANDFASTAYVRGTIMDKHKWAKDDWLANPWGELFLKGLKFLWPFIAIAGGLALFIFAFRLGPLIFMMILVGMIYLIQKFRWAMHDSMG